MMLAIGEKKMGNWQEALKAVGSSLEEEEGVEALLFRAKLHSKMKNYPLAINDLNKILLINPQHAIATLLKVRCFVA